MTDPIWSGRPSYRPLRHRRGPNQETRRLLLGATILMIVLLILVGGGLLLRPDGPVPVIEAENRPLRVRPDDPGALQVPGLSDQVLGNEAELPVILAPLQEEPAAAALEARTQAAEGPELTDDSPDPPGPAKVTSLPKISPEAPVPSASHPPIKRQVTPVLALPVPRAAPAPRSDGSTGKVQLAAMGSQADARSEWKRLSHQVPELLGGRTPLIERANIKGRTIWRLRLGGFTDRADAIAFCDRLRLAALRCSPIHPR